MIEIVPAIDIIGGRCVRLSQGDYGRSKVYDTPVVDMARSLADCGVRRLHLVDLDGAKAGVPANLQTLEAVATAVDMELEWGGGVSSQEALDCVFNAGADFAIVGSVAAREPEQFAGWLARYGAKMILGADVRDGRIAVKGWLEEVDLTIDALVERFRAQGLRECIVTDISRDGMLQGPSTGLYIRLQAEFPELNFTVSGGISAMDDVRALDTAGLRKVIIGKALYEGRISLEDIALWSRNA